ncbi:MAG: cytidylate kinase-like family protein [Bacteroidales bacterium]
MKKNYIITIGRQLGSGGREIGQKLSERLGISFYDKELIRLASQESGLKEDVFEQADEKKRFSLFGGLLSFRGTPENEIYLNYYLTNETLFKIQSDVIRGLAEQKSCIFVGRCADYVLKENPRCLTVFISADMNDRIIRVAENQNLSKNKALDCIKKTDKKRAGYYNYFSGKEWGVAESYNLCISSSVLGIDETVTFICHFAEKRFELK